MVRFLKRAGFEFSRSYRREMMAFFRQLLAANLSVAIAVPMFASTYNAVLHPSKLDM
jgi:hypothetical protein